MNVWKEGGRLAMSHNTKFHTCGMCVYIYIHMRGHNVAHAAPDFVGEGCLVPRPLHVHHLRPTQIVTPMRTRCWINAHQGHKSLLHITFDVPLHAQLKARIRNRAMLFVHHCRPILFASPFPLRLPSTEPDSASQLLLPSPLLAVMWQHPSSASLPLGSHPSLATPTRPNTTSPTCA